MQQMGVLSEQAVVLNWVAKTTNLLREVIRLVVHEMQGAGDIFVLVDIIVELNRARVDVVIFHFPGAELSLEGLELRAWET